MPSNIIPLSHGWQAQPGGSARLNAQDVKYIGAYSGQHGLVNIATGQPLTRGSAVAVRAQAVGLALNQTVVNAGAWCPVKSVASVNQKYIALWHGVFVGAIVGSSPKLVGVSNSSTSQSTDIVGLTREANDTITVTVKLAGTSPLRTFSVGASAWYGKTVTLIGFYEISTTLIWLYVNVDGVVSKYSSLLSFSGDPSPTILGTEQFCVGTDVVENPTRSPNVHTALAACFHGAVHNQYIESRLRNPWQIFAPRETYLFTPIGAGGGVNATGSGSLASVTVSAPTGSAAGSASASGAFAQISVSAATGTASGGAVVNATGAGSFAGLSVSPATGTATGGSAGSATASGSFAPISISPATAIAIGSAVAQGGFQSIGITAPTGSASATNPSSAIASGSFASITITPATGTASNGTFASAPSGAGPAIISAGTYRPQQSTTSRRINTGGRRY